MLRPHGLHLKVLLMIQYHLHNLMITLIIKNILKYIIYLTTPIPPCKQIILSSTIAARGI